MQAERVSESVWDERWLPVMARKPSNTRRPASTGLRAAQVVVFVALAACAPRDDAGSGEPSAAAATAESPTESENEHDAAAAFATQGPLAVTAAEFEREIAWRSWLTREPVELAYSANWRDDDALLGRISAQLLDTALLRYDADRWGLAVGEDDRHRIMREMPRLAPLVDLSDHDRDAAMAGEQIGWEDVVAHADLIVLMEMWNAHRIESLTDDDLERAYLLRHDRATLETAIVPNVHPRETIDRILVERSAEIDAYYYEHRNFFLMPRSARVREVAVEGAESDGEARQRTEALLEQAAAGELDALLAAEDVAQPLTRGNDGVWIPHARFPAAFDVLPGELSGLVHHERHWIFFEVLEHRGREFRPLDDDVRAQIAHHIAREESPAAEAMARAGALADALRADPSADADVYREHRVLVETTTPFERTPTGVVPTVGIAPALSALVFADDTEAGDVLGPVHVQAGVVVARVIDRDRPAVDDFVTNRAAFEEEFAEYMMQHAWPARVAEFGGLYERSVDLEALRAVLSAGAHAPE